MNASVTAAGIQWTFANLYWDSWK